MRGCKSVVIILFFYPAVGFAQVDKLLNSLSADSTWRRGALIMDNDQILNGFVRFDQLSPRVAFKKTERGETQMILVRKVVAAKIADGNQSRMFATYEVETAQGKADWLCQVVMETHSFVVLSYTQLEIFGKESAGGSYPRIKGRSNSERILLAWNDSQDAEEIAYLPNFMDDGEKMADFSAGWLSRLPKFQQGRVLQYMKSHEPEIKQYLKKHKVVDVIGGAANPAFRDELFELLKYYQAIEREMH